MFRRADTVLVPTKLQPVTTSNKNIVMMLYEIKMHLVLN